MILSSHVAHFGFLTCSCVLSNVHSAVNQRQKRKQQRVATSEDDANHDLTYFQPMGAVCVFVSWHMDAHASQSSGVWVTLPYLFGFNNCILSVPVNRNRNERRKNWFHATKRQIKIISVLNCSHAKTMARHIQPKWFLKHQNQKLSAAIAQSLHFAGFCRELHVWTCWIFQ